MAGNFAAHPPEARGAAHTHVGGVEVRPLATDLRAGTTVSDYRLGEVVGRGGMGVVYRARDEVLERTVALKLLSPDLAADAEFRERFIRESRMAAALEHPHVVPVYDAGEDDDVLYIAMRYVDGTDLGTLLRRQGALEPAEALAIATQVGSALNAAHERSIVHRDVKPANVLLDRHGAYLSDFGLMRHTASDTRLTAHGEFVGTVEYMPPEQIEGGPLDPRSDVYAFGCVLYHMLTGAPPFHRESAVSVMHAQLHERPPASSKRHRTLPEALDTVFERALAKRRSARYGTCLDLVAAARAVLAGNPSVPQAAGAPRTASTLVVVVARDDRLRSAIRGLLGSDRFAFVEAGDHEDAVRVVRESRPEVVLLEWGLSGSPLELCSELRDAAGGAGVRLVAFASRSEVPDEQTRSAAGVDAAVVWPSSALRLQLELAEVLSDDDVVLDA